MGSERIGISPNTTISQTLMVMKTTMEISLTSDDSNIKLDDSTVY